MQEYKLLIDSKVEVMVSSYLYWYDIVLVILVNFI